MNKAGFTLIEVLVAIAISAVLGMIIMNGLFQAQLALRVTQVIIDVRSKQLLLQSQLERDLYGAFVPLQAQLAAAQQQQKEKADAQAKANQAAAQKTNGQTPPTPPTPPPAPIPAIERVFYGSNQGAHLDTLTFITHNPLQTYWGSKAGHPVPRIARVTYHLRPDKVHTHGTHTAYMLTRQESPNLTDQPADQKSTQAKEFVLVDNLASFSVSYRALKPPKPPAAPTAAPGTPPVPAAQPAGSPAAAKKPKPTLETYKQWTFDQKQLKEQGIPPIPYALEVRASLWGSGKQQFPFSFKVFIVSKDEIAVASPSVSTPQIPQAPVLQEKRQQLSGMFTKVIRSGGIRA